MSISLTLLGSSWFCPSLSNSCLFNNSAIEIKFLSFVLLPVLEIQLEDHLAAREAVDLVATVQYYAATAAQRADEQERNESAEESNLVERGIRISIVS